LAAAKPAILFTHKQLVFFGIRDNATLSCFDTKRMQKNQGFILSFPPIVGIIFTCTIATFWVIF